MLVVDTVNRRTYWNTTTTQVNSLSADLRFISLIYIFNHVMFTLNEQDLNHISKVGHVLFMPMLSKNTKFVIDSS